MDPGASDVMAVIDQSLDMILKTSRKMRECMEVSGDPSLPADAQSMITDSSRKLILLKTKMENLVQAYAETKSQVCKLESSSCLSPSVKHVLGAEGNVVHMFVVPVRQGKNKVHAMSSSLQSLSRREKETDAAVSRNRERLFMKSSFSFSFHDAESW